MLCLARDCWSFELVLMAPPSLPPPAKRRKLQKDSDLVQSIQKLEAKLTADTTSLNPLADLLELALGVEDAQDTSKAIYALYRAFVVVITSGKLNAGGDEAAKIVRTWIWERLNGYVDFLCGLLKDEEKALRTSALQILFSLQKHLSTAATVSDGHPQFHVPHFRKIVSALLECPPSSRSSQSTTGVLDADVLHLFHETWFSVHDDIRWFFLREAGTIVTTSSASPQNLLSILERLNTFPTDKAELNAWWVAELGAKPPKPKASKRGAADSEDEENDESADAEDDWRKFFDEDTSAKEKSLPKNAGARLHTLSVHQSLHSLQSHRAVFTRAWLTLLPKISGENALRKALGVMHRGVMPHLTRPVLVMDWVGGSVDHGGTVGLLALNALFMLMKEYNLDYPAFYTKLYAFLDRDVLHSKLRARFFRLTELFLSSTHLPAALVASFVKRLAHLSLSAPPAAIVLVLPFTYNALKRHPALMPMIHRVASDADADADDADAFDATEPNPLLTKAIDSSLWELASHRSHWLAGVSTMSRILEEAFTKQGYAMEDFLDHTYGTLFDADANRKIKKEPPVAMEMGQSVKRLFGQVEGEEEVQDVVCELWSFA
ncbi:Ribosome biogenesis protein Noc4 [Mycena kentingensis (nom. inval.)]|nr:Ribosome biogenesis protein Noc4 [Mycena kentingensis (nom. inval.)]